MPLPIEDYAIIGDCQSAALVGRNGSIDWMCLPRFDSGACFAALLGGPENGLWRIAPAVPIRRMNRRYRDGTLILETEFETDSGTVLLIDFMPLRSRAPDLVRIVECTQGKVPMRLDCTIRFDYGSIVPWVRQIDGRGIRAIAGPDSVRLLSDVTLHGEELSTVANFTVSESESRSFVLTWYRTHHREPPSISPQRALKTTEQWWRQWSRKSKYTGRWGEHVERSLITLKALTFEPTGGIVAAATTSLPEKIGGVRNWDYRFCWLRDATFTLLALLDAGYTLEAQQWREWLLRAVAGSPSRIQILYGIAGERRLPEMELPWLPGYENSAPVRIGNAASRQHQLDVYGEVMDALHVARRAGLPPDENAWRLQRAMLDFLESDWTRPDEGIWEVRGPRRHFTHSKVMAWVAADRAIKAVEHFHRDGPVERWRALRQEIHREVCREGFDEERNSFVQYYGSKDLDASLLLLPLVGFLPETDGRVRGTIEAIQRELSHDGLVMRYRCRHEVDGLPPGEGAFLACSFWLVDDLVLLRRHEEALELFERLVALCNDVGLLSEEYDPVNRRFLGNFPQAFSHVGLVNSACNLSRRDGPAEERKDAESEEL